MAVPAMHLRNEKAWARRPCYGVTATFNFRPIDVTVLPSILPSPSSTLTSPLAGNSTRTGEGDSIATSNFPPPLFHSQITTPRGVGTLPFAHANLPGLGATSTLAYPGSAG